MGTRRSRLPSEQPSAASSWSTVEAVVLIAVVVVVAVNAWMIHHIAGGVSFQPGHISGEQWARLEELSEPVETLVVGDSVCLVGIDPAQLGEELDGRATNLCTFDGMALLDDAWMVQRYIERLGPPDRVVIDHAYSVWSRGRGDLALGTLGNLGASDEEWRRYEPPLDLTEAAATAEYRARFPLFYANRTVGRVLRDPAALFGLRHDDTLPGGFAQLDPSDRFRDVTKIEAMVSGASAPSVGWPEGSTVSPLNRASLRAIIDLAQEHSFEVYVVPQPVASAIADTPEVRAEIDALEEEIVAIVGPAEGVHVLIDDPPMFELVDLFDPVHVLEPAIHRYTAEIAGLIRSADG